MKLHHVNIVLFVAVFLGTSLTIVAQEQYYSSIQHIPCPKGFERVTCAGGSFGEWLRALKLKKSNVVYLYNGQLKGNQFSQFAVVDIDVGKQDLQQCADACMRLRAEYLFATNQKEKIRFRFTNGTDATFVDWMNGKRPHIKGNSVRWTKDTKPNDSYAALREYLIPVFRFCGTASLEKELPTVSVHDIQIGDIVIKGGFPGHAIMAVDMCRNAQGKTMMMLVQSYMPAQDIHVLRNPENPTSPWYEVRNESVLETPEWTFTDFTHQIRRFQ
ncbi:MAG: DUF4846 domain-containing protein [Bacteriodetes bacterium]|nr:DUF4846 domain-containing protein [Bacteroidota bacterium]